jgi:hypothetical protein
MSLYFLACTIDNLLDLIKDPKVNSVTNKVNFLHEIITYYTTCFGVTATFRHNTNIIGIASVSWLKPNISIRWGYAVAQLVETLWYKPEGREFNSWWFIGIFHWHNPSGRTLALGLTQPLTETSTRNICWGKGGRCVRLTLLPLSYANCLKIWEPQPPGNLRASPGL